MIGAPADRFDNMRIFAKVVESGSFAGAAAIRRYGRVNAKRADTGAKSRKHIEENVRAADIVRIFGRHYAGTQAGSCWRYIGGLTPSFSA
jgi:hypothetical protein